jgi:hypothetical protein
MRIRIIHRPPETSIDGIRLDRFEPGFQYEVGNSLGAVFLAEGWAEPVDLNEPALLVPFSDTDPFDTRRLYRPIKESVDLVKQQYPAARKRTDVAAEFKRRRKKRAK